MPGTSSRWLCLGRTGSRSRKDVQQAALLIEHLLQADSARLRQAYAAFAGGRSRIKLIENGLRLLPADLRHAAQVEAG
jgi:hypothetical protein